MHRRIPYTRRLKCASAFSTRLNHKNKLQRVPEPTSQRVVEPRIIKAPSCNYLCVWLKCKCCRPEYLQLVMYANREQISAWDLHLAVSWHETLPFVDRHCFRGYLLLVYFKEPCVIKTFSETNMVKILQRYVNLWKFMLWLTKSILMLR